jgi:protein O-mannosyl-transferase
MTPADRGKRSRSRPAGVAASAGRGPDAARRPGTARGPAPRDGRTRRFWRHPALASALAAFVLYLPGLGARYVWDDHLLIEQNPLLRGGAGLVRALTSDFWSASGGSGASGMWRPVVTLSYALDLRLAHGDPGWSHVVNALAHALCSALVATLALAAGAGGIAAGLAGLLFAALPAHLESVAWVSGRTDVFCALFFLLALWLDRRARARGRSWPGPAPLVALALALLSKETALPFVVVAAAAERIGSGERRPGALESARWLAPYALLTLAQLLVHRAWVEGPAGAAAVARGDALRGLGLMFPGYLAFAWPWFAHTPAVTLDVARASTLAVAGGAALHLAFVAWLAWLLWRRAAVALPLALFWLTLLPTLAVDLARGYLLYSERFFYLPSAGLAWAAAAGLAALVPGAGAGGTAPAWRAVARRAGLALLVALVAASAWATSARLPAWHDDASLFRAMAHDAPNSYMARTQWARQLALAGRVEEAALELAAARALDPARAEEPSVRAYVASRRGDWPAVLDGADAALARGSSDLEPRLLRATALLALDRRAEGAAALDSLRQRAPGNPAVESLWGQFLVSAGRAAEAYPVLARAAAMLPGDAAVAQALALAANDTGHHAEARAALERALGTDPSRYDAWLELARTCVALDDRAGALRALDQAGRLPAAADGRAAMLRAALGGAP